MKTGIPKMKKKIFYLILILFLSCKHNNSKPEGVSVSIIEDSINTSENIIKDEDCIFDQTTQTDEFLKGIKELENYVWNQETKTATIKLSDVEILEIYRGGCAHFGLSATFTFNDKKILYPIDKEFIIEKSLWISRILKEFAFDEISKSFESNGYMVDIEDNDSYIFDFKDPYLIDNHYSIWIKNNPTHSNIEISFYIN